MAKPTLDGLPVELRVLVLFQVPDGDINTLKALVLASPGYHQAYLMVRRELLELHVEHLYREPFDLGEALTAIRSKGLHFTVQAENAISLLDKWRRRNEIRELSHSSPSGLDNPDGLEEIIKLLHFHKMLCFFLKDYSTNAPKPPWIPPIQWENEHLPLHFSISEKSRFIRAVCRLQTLKNLFGDKVECPKEHCDSCGHRQASWQSGEIDSLMKYSRPGRPWAAIREMAYRLFYGTMTPWEYEEMGSAFGYLRTKIEAISTEVSDDLRQLCQSTPCYFFCDILPKEQRPPCGEPECEGDLAYLHNHFKGLAGLGPQFLYDILRTDRLSRRNVFCKNIRGHWEPFIGVRGELSWTERFPFIDPADQHESAKFDQLWSTLPPLDQPTVGWKKAWLLPHSEEDTLEDSLNINRKSETDWNWSYAFWDETGLRTWEAPLLSDDSPVVPPPARVFYSVGYDDVLLHENSPE